MVRFWLYVLMASMPEFNPDWRIHPSYTLRDVMKDRGMTMEELARFSGVYVTHLNAILWNGAPMQEWIAEQLEKCLGIKASFWMALQDWYDRPT